MYEVQASLVETRVWKTGAGIPPLKSEKGDLMKGVETDAWKSEPEGLVFPNCTPTYVGVGPTYGADGGMCPPFQWKPWTNEEDPTGPL